MIEFQTTYFSPAVGMQIGARILVPDSGPSGKPTLYLLHGLSDDHSIWHRRSSVERFVEPCELVVVMPNGGRGFYTDAEEGARWGEAISNELISKVESWFGVAQSTDARFVAGLSMGGYGALRLALANPGTYACAASMSGAVMIGSLPVKNSLRDLAFQREMERIFGQNPVGTNHDLLALAERCKATNGLPRLWMDCGLTDFLFDDNQAFYARLQNLEIPITYKIMDGSHNWQYWNEALPEILRWMGFDPAP